MQQMLLLVKLLKKCSIFLSSDLEEKAWLTVNRKSAAEVCTVREAWS
jgi:hypothetical protein